MKFKTLTANFLQIIKIESNQSQWYYMNNQCKNYFSGILVPWSLSKFQEIKKYDIMFKTILQELKKTFSDRVTRYNLTKMLCNNICLKRYNENRKVSL